MATLFFLGLKEILPKRIFPEIATDNPNMVIDSLLLEAIWEEENFTTFQKQETDTVLVIAEKEKVIEEFQQPNSQEHLTLFFEKLAKLEEDKKGKIRIGYFGDSMTDGDYIVQDLRRFSQEKVSGLCR